MNENRVTPSPRYFVMFTGITKRGFITDYASPLWCQHVLAFHYDPIAGMWMVLEVNRGGTAQAALTAEQFDRWIEYMRGIGARVLSMSFQPRTRFPIQIGMWCVVSVRNMLGLKSCAIRPIGLWRDMLKAGAVEEYVKKDAAA